MTALAQQRSLAAVIVIAVGIGAARLPEGPAMFLYGAALASLLFGFRIIQASRAGLVRYMLGALTLIVVIEVLRATLRS